MHARFGRVALAIVLASAAAACTRPTGNEINVSDEGMKNGVAAARYLTPVALDSLEIGRSLDADKTIKDETSSFQPKDTVYAAIRISGSANSGLVRALWTDSQGKTLEDDTRLVTPSRSDLVNLQAAPPDGWKDGDYTLSVYLDDKLAATRNFTVEGGGNQGNSQQGAEKAGPASH